MTDTFSRRAFGLWLLVALAFPLNAQDGTDRGQGMVATAGVIDPVLQPSALSLAEAVQLAFVNNPELHVARVRIQGAEGALMQAQGAFDWNYFAGLGLGRTLSKVEIETDGGAFHPQNRQRLQNLTIGATQPLRSGVEVTSSLQLVGDHNSFLGETSGTNTGTADVTVKIPLLPIAVGDRQFFTWQERASEQILAASRNEEIRRRAEKAFEVVAAYWQYRAAHEYYQLERGTEERTRQLLEQVQALVAADELAAAHIDGVRATLETRRLQRLIAAETIIATRNALAGSIGLPPERARDLPQPMDAFPSADLSLLPESEQHALLVQRALQQRRDLAALSQQEQAAFESMRAARLEQGANLDLDVRLSYTGTRSGHSSSDYLRAVREISVGPSFNVTLNYAFAPNQRVQKGAYRQRTAERDELAIQQQELRRSIATNLESSLMTLRQTALRVRQAEQAVQLHRLALEREEDRLRLGQATVTEVLRVHDDVAGAESTLVQQQVTFSVALAEILLGLEEIIVYDPQDPEYLQFALARVLGNEAIAGR